MYTTYAATFFTAFAVSYLVSRLVRSLARRAGVVDRPDGFRKMQRRPIPLLGGVGVYVAFFAALVVACLLSGKGGGPTYLFDADFWTLLAGATAVLSVGAVDDVRGLSASRKFLALLVVSGTMYACGDRIGGVGTPFGPLNLGWFALPVTLFWFMGCMNSLNLIDGMDGAASGVAAFAAFTLFLCAALMGNASSAIFGLCLAGSAGGFLVLNFHPASIYLGDSGSLLLGFLLASIGLRGAQKGPMMVALLIPVIALGLPIIDTSLAIIRRWARGLPLSATDREHIHHKLQALGMGHRAAALVMYGACVVLALFALLLTSANSTGAAWLLVGLGVAMTAAVRVLGVHELKMAKKRACDLYRNMKVRNKRRVAAHVTSGRMEHVDDVDALWRLLLEGAESIELDELVLNLECGDCAHCDCCGLGHAFSWQRPAPFTDDDHHVTWTATVPLHGRHRRLGEMTICKRTNGQPLGIEVPEALELLATAFAVNACRVRSAEDTRPEPAHRADDREPVGVA